MILKCTLSYTYCIFDQCTCIIIIPFTTTSVITQDGDTALMLAAWSGHTEVVVELVKAKANLDLQNKVCDSVNCKSLCNSPTLKNTIVLHHNIYK